MKNPQKLSRRKKDALRIAGLKHDLEQLNSMEIETQNENLRLAREVGTWERAAVALCGLAVVRWVFNSRRRW